MRLCLCKRTSPIVNSVDYRFRCSSTKQLFLCCSFVKRRGLCGCVWIYPTPTAEWLNLGCNWFAVVTTVCYTQNSKPKGMVMLRISATFPCCIRMLVRDEIERNVPV